MIRRIMGKSHVLKISLAVCACASLLVLGSALSGQDQPAAVKPWVAPADARVVKNPVPVTPEGLAAAAKLFKDNCMICHGEKGMGMGNRPRHSTGSPQILPTK